MAGSGRVKAGQGSKHFFFEKKKQKTFIRQGLSDDHD
jgi:hypothetical protein